MATLEALDTHQQLLSKAESGGGVLMRECKSPLALHGQGDCQHVAAKQGKGMQGAGTTGWVAAGEGTPSRLPRLVSLLRCSLSYPVVPMVGPLGGNRSLFVCLLSVGAL